MSVTALLVLAAVGAACRQDMHDQPTYSPLESSSFYADGSSSRPPIPGTVARGHLRDDAELYTGRLPSDEPTEAFPFAVDQAVMARGQDMFNAYCSACHGKTGAGNGMVVERGFSRPPSLTEDRLLTMPVGHFFDVITNGIGAMPDHASQIAVEDRWAIVAYIRALQLSVTASVEDVPPAERARLEQAAP
jgi:mono/diheme cytochrome c family protein